MNNHIQIKRQARKGAIMIIIFMIAGFVILIPTALFLLLYAENILLFDSLILSVLSAIWIRTIAGIHPVFCILIGIGVLAGTMMLYTQQCIFWIFTVISSMMYGAMLGTLINDITNDCIWGIFIGLVTGIVTLLFHMGVRVKYYG